MYLLFLLLRPAILWMILYYIVGIDRVPNFRPFFLVYLLASVGTGFLTINFGWYALIPNFIIFAGLLTLIYQIEFLKTLLSVVIFFCISVGIELILKILGVKQLC
ncbi:MAG: hypothetical protein K8S56_02570 [Candidatus Cloacimonetes bacterium]|nr:hypothetical protein [Candidatus Cloacimonadota bacterium]